MSAVSRIIDINTDVVLHDEAQWAEKFGVEGVHAIEADVRVWARAVLTKALAEAGIGGHAR